MHRLTGWASCAAVLAGVSALLACGSGASDASGRDRPLAPYSGHETLLFDDSIDPKAVGFELEKPSEPMTDASLRERTQVGDSVVRARVMTVTSKDEDRGRTWQLGFRTLEHLAGPRSMGEEFTVELGPHSPSAGIVHAWDVRLIGMPFIVFLREFTKPDSPGDAALHFHLARDTKEEQAAVRAAALDRVH